MNEQRIEEIRRRLNERFAPDALEVVDDSERHRGHPGARDGRGHFMVRIVSEQFAGLPRLARHRLVYAAVGDMMRHDIHALNIEAISRNDK